MASTLYYILLGVYGIALIVSLFYYLSRRAPGGDASVGWAIGVFYMAGLAGVMVVAVLLRNKPVFGLMVLSIPLVFLALPRIRSALTGLYVRFPAFSDTPPLTLFLDNNTSSKLHVKLECWFGTAKRHRSTLYTTFDYYLEPLEKAGFPLTAHQTRLLAHKSKYVTIMTYEQVREEYEGHAYWREIQPCMQFFDEQPEAFRAGEYRVVIEAGVS